MEPQLPLVRLLATATHGLVEEMHAALADAGHPAVRPAHGFALNAIGDAGVTTADLARKLGMTKQGAAKLVESLAGLGYVRRVAHDADARARLVVLTPAGRDVLDKAAAIQQRLEARWARAVGAGTMRELRSALERVVPLDEHGDPPSPRPIW